MKFKQYILLALPAACLAVGFAACKKEYNDTSFVTTAGSIANPGVMFSITQDNTGLVTITPSGTSAVSFDIVFGDATTAAVSVAAGSSAKHAYAEGDYQVKVTGHDLKGGTAVTTQPLTVSYVQPKDLAAKISSVGLTLSVSASAKYATFYKIYYGDSTTYSPEPFTQVLANQAVTHTYKNAGDYTVRVVALSGGAETSEIQTSVHVIKQIDLPVTFDDPNTDYTLGDFGGNGSSLVTDPAGGSNMVMKTTKPAGSETWAGTTVGNASGFATPVPLKANAAKLSLRVYAPAAGITIRLKVEDHGNKDHSVETDAVTTKANQWETLTFDFTNTASGTPVLTAGWVYDKASVFFEFNQPGTGKVFYIDDLEIASAPLTQIDLPVTFDNSTVDYTLSDFGNNSSAIVTDPAGGSNHVVKTVKNNGAEIWSGTTLGTATGFATIIPQATPAKMTVRVYSPASGLTVKLKLEEHATGSHSVETDQKTTTANAWETLTFDFSQNSSGTPAWDVTFKYDKCSIFLDYGVTGTGKIFYWDDVIKL